MASKPKPNAATIPFIEKYRPKTLDEVHSHQDLISNVKRMINSGQLPHLLFFGPAGTGKTSTAGVIARQMYGNSFAQNVLELNASDDRGIDVIRDQVKNFISSVGFQVINQDGRKLPKMVILDEADNMTKTAQFALRRMMEEFSSNSRFVICCNYLHKIIMPLQSRCSMFRLAVLPKADVVECIDKVQKAESINLSEEAVGAIVRIAGGDLRKVLNILQACSMKDADEITADDIYLFTGTPTETQLRDMVHTLFNLPLMDAYDTMLRLFDVCGHSLVGVINWLYEEVQLIKMPLKARAKIIPAMAEVQSRIEMGANQNVQLLGLCGAFALARCEMEMIKRSEDYVSI